MDQENDGAQGAQGAEPAQVAKVIEFGIERRVIGPGAELRFEDPADEAGEPTIEGYAAIFDSESEDLGGFIETIEPGAFAKTIAEADVRALRNHNADLVLGRTRAGTLELSEDQKGLRFRITVPAVSWARDLLVSMRRGDVDQMSFGFEAIRDRWETIGGQVYRRLLEVRLFDVSVVTFPAYAETLAEVRAKAIEAGAEPSRAAHSDQGSGAEDRRGRRARNRARLALIKARQKQRSRGER